MMKATRKRRRKRYSADGSKSCPANVAAGLRSAKKRFGFGLDPEESFKPAAYFTVIWNMDAKRRKWRILEHTADIRIEVMGADLPELFANAALALTELLTGESGLSRASDAECEKRLVTIEADCAEDLIVNWLREILFMYEAEQFLVTRVDIGSVSDTRISATLCRGTPANREEEAGLDIKAVTYHNVSIRKQGDALAVRLVLDV